MIATYLAQAVRHSQIKGAAVDGLEYRPGKHWRVVIYRMERAKAGTLYSVSPMPYTKADATSGAALVNRFMVEAVEDYIHAVQKLVK